ncbi:MAG TPA: CCA tRNA nucleotidyltransferase [Alphaproteobacteria bacterium]
MNDLPSLDVLLQDKGAQAIHAVYQARGRTVKFVGGCVRDILAGIPIGDIDLAVDAEPEDGLKWLSEAGITVKATGLKYGTITAIIHKKPYEITTLRRDIKTDGRWAEVVYGTSWEEDAQRRDFTINGLFCTMDGQVEDHVGGVEDLQQGHIRFIGDAATRIREDYLRILRLFRFWARFGKSDIDKATLAAVQENAEGIANLSKQRVWAELKKTLSLPRVAEALRQMQAAHITPYIFNPDVFHLRHLEKLLDYETAAAVPACAQEQASKSLRHLAALHLQDIHRGNWSVNWQDLSERFLLSGHETDHLSVLNLFGEKPDYWLERPNAALYQFEPDVLADAYLLCAVTDHLDADQLRTKLYTTRQSQKMHLPVTANDLMERGYKAGPELGAALHKVRQYWLDHDCQPDQDECLTALKN